MTEGGEEGEERWRRRMTEGGEGEERRRREGGGEGEERRRWRRMTEGGGEGEERRRAGGGEGEERRVQDPSFCTEDNKHIDMIAHINTTIYYSTGNTLLAYNYTTIQIILY